MTQCGLCKDCKWWDESRTEIESFGFCNHLLPGKNQGIYELVGGSIKEFRPAKTILMEKDFGCIQFEPKTEEG